MTATDPKQTQVSGIEAPVQSSSKMYIRRYRSEDAAAIASIFTRSVLEIGRKDYTIEPVKVWASLAASKEQAHARCADGRTVLVAVDDLNRPLR